MRRLLVSSARRGYRRIHGLGGIEEWRAVEGSRGWRYRRAAHGRSNTEGCGSFRFFDLLACISRRFCDLGSVTMLRECDARFRRCFRYEDRQRVRWHRRARGTSQPRTPKFEPTEEIVSQAERRTSGVRRGCHNEWGSHRRTPSVRYPASVPISPSYTQYELPAPSLSD